MSSTTPQDRAVQALVEKFQCDRDGIIGQLSADPRNLAACKKTGDGFLDFGAVTLGEIADCLADAGLLSSGTQEEEDGSLRSEPSAAGEVSVYVELSGRRVGYTVEEYDGALNVDMDDYDEPVGVEILDARKVTINGRQVHPPKAIGEADIELVAEALRDFRLNLGPNTLGFIRNGQDSVALTGSERHQIAHAAVSALRPVPTDE